MWNDLQTYFPNNKNGSRILVTSRIESVALEAKHDSEPHVLRLLTDSESFELLKRKLFQTQDCPIDVQDVLMKIARDYLMLFNTLVVFLQPWKKNIGKILRKD